MSTFVVRACHIVAGCCMLALVGCGQTSHQALITGEPILYGVDRSTGALIDSDIWPSAPDSPDPAIVPAKDVDIVKITLNSLFIKELLEDEFKLFGSPHLLVYAEVYDDGGSDPAQAFTTVITDSENQPPGVLVGQRGMTIYGPTPYTGFPIRIKFVVVELDKKDKEDATKLLRAAGSLTKFAPTEAALPIGIAIDIAEILNQLNEDDYELRFDLVLSPQQPSAGTYDLGSTEEANKKLHRQGKRYTMTTALRTGSYLILKRELPGRRVSSSNVDRLNSTLMFDAAALTQSRRFRGKDGLTYRTKERYRVQNDQLFHVIESIKRAEYTKVTRRDKDGKKLKHPKKVKMAEETVDNVRVVLLSGRNAGQEFRLMPGERLDFTTQTYALITVSVGGDAALTREQMRAASKRDTETIRKSLEDPALASGALDSAIESATGTLTTLLKKRAVRDATSARVRADPTFRTSTEFPKTWASQLVTTAPADPTEKRNAVATNRAILQGLESIVINLPITDPTDFEAIADLASAEFEAADSSPGRFKITNPEG